MKPHLRTLPVKLDPHEVAQRAPWDYVRITFRDLDTGKQWSWRMRADVAATRAAEHVAAWARDGQRVEVVS